MSRPTTCIIVDDEKPARELVQHYAHECKLEIIGLAKNTNELKDLLAEKHPDILFSDINMPGLNGIDFLKLLPVKPLTILTTAYTEYAVEGFELDVVDYLVKPFSLERFKVALQKAKQRLISLPAEEETILIKHNYKWMKIPKADIVMIEGMKEYVAVITDKGDKYLLLDSLKNMESMMGDNFLRCHKSFIVNVSKILALGASEIQLDGITVPIGRSFKSKVSEVYKD